MRDKATLSQRITFSKWLVVISAALVLISNSFEIETLQNFIDSKPGLFILLSIFLIITTTVSTASLLSTRTHFLNHQKPSIKVAENKHSPAQYYQLSLVFFSLLLLTSNMVLSVAGSMFEVQPDALSRANPKFPFFKLAFNIALVIVFVIQIYLYNRQMHNRYPIDN